MDISDEDLVAQYVEGDTAALGKLLDRYRRPLYAVLLRMVSSPSEADDLFQEVWLKVIRNAGEFRRQSFKGWVFRITHNLLIDTARCRKKTVSLDAPGERDGEMAVGERMAAAGVGVREQVDGHEAGHRIAKAVASLPEDQREVFMLRTEADMTFRDIARIQGVSINTALARMQYAIEKLQRALRSDYEALRGAS